MNNFNYKWYLKDGFPSKNIKENKLKVFSTFSCGGGSSMGYKLAGYDVIGANDIDPQMEKVYKENLKPKTYFLCPIGDLLKIDLPEELYNLDILDGSPPCSTFSMAGSREKVWKKDKKFREGQSEQVLSDLFFDFIDLTKKLQPKVFVAENVQGMLLGNAKSYTRTIIKKFSEAGYKVQLFLLDSSFMGVPQKRKRVFFIGIRNDIYKNDLKLDFNFSIIKYSDLIPQVNNELGKVITPAYYDLWNKTPIGKSLSYNHPKSSFFNSIKISPDKPLPTITASSAGKLIHFQHPNDLSKEILTLAGSFPMDYNYLDIDPKYLIGMSVPPIMMAQVANEINLQIFNKK